MSLCFFVDGLDEFSGDTEQLCMLFKRLEKGSGVAKFCLSSRPWVAFQENLEHCPKLRLQDFTFKDIEIYVRDNYNLTLSYKKKENENGTSTFIGKFVIENNRYKKEFNIEGRNCNL